VAANLFANGGNSITLQAGHYAQVQDEQSGQFYEAWVPGVNKQTDEVLLRAICDADPSGGRSPSEFNIFTAPVWSLHGNDGKASSVGAVLGPRLGTVPPQEAVAAVPLELSTENPYYLVKKYIASLFGHVLARGGFEMAVVLQKGSVRTENIPYQKIIIESRETEELVRDEDDMVVYDVVLDDEGKPVTEMKRDQFGRPVRDERTGGPIYQQKMRQRTKTVRRDFEKPITEVNTVQVTPVYLQVVKIPQLNPQDFESVVANESMYDPTWMLGDLLNGVHLKSRPFQRVTSEEVG